MHFAKLNSYSQQITNNDHYFLSRCDLNVCCITEDIHLIALYPSVSSHSSSILKIFEASHLSCGCVVLHSNNIASITITLNYTNTPITYLAILVAWWPPNQTVVTSQGPYIYIQRSFLFRMPRVLGIQGRVWKIKTQAILRIWLNNMDIVYVCVYVCVSSTLGALCNLTELS